MNVITSRMSAGLFVLATLCLSGCSKPQLERNELAAPVIDEITVKKLQEPKE